MRMYNPEWERIKEFSYAPKVKDVAFDLSSGELPADHGYELFQELARHLPWLRETPGVGVLPVHGAPTGRNNHLVINKRVKLVLRLPVDRVAEAAALVGQTLRTSADDFTVGGLKEKLLTPYATLYSPFVVLDAAEEVAFLAAAAAELERLGVKAGMICGKPRKMRLPEGEACGFSLMLHDLDLPQSLMVMEQGMGQYREYGCGNFVPHKSIKEVVID